MSLTDDAHALLEAHFDNKPKQIAVDATCGNGFDTEFLANLDFLKVHAFDIQEAAINTTKNRLSKHTTTSIEVHLASHATMAKFIEHHVDCFMFNFGYLPGGDKNLTTATETTINALNVASKLLNDDGLISLMCYPGHPSGMLETQAIKTWLADLSDHFIVETHLAASPKPTAPILYIVKRTKT